MVNIEFEVNGKSVLASFVGGSIRAAPEDAQKGWENNGSTEEAFGPSRDRAARGRRSDNCRSVIGSGLPMSSRELVLGTGALDAGGMPCGRR